MAPCVLSLPLDCCFVVYMVDCACAHAENNITCLTLPFFLVLHRRVHTRNTQTHTPFLRRTCVLHSLSLELPWCGHWVALRLLIIVVLWQLSLSGSTLPPSFLPLSFSPSCANWSCLYHPPFFPVHPSISRPNPHPFFFLLQRDGCLFLVRKPSCHISGAKGGFRRVFGEAEGLSRCLQRFELGPLLM